MWSRQSIKVCQKRVKSEKNMKWEKNSRKEAIHLSAVSRNRVHSVFDLRRRRIYGCTEKMGRKPNFSGFAVTASRNNYKCIALLLYASAFDLLFSLSFVNLPHYEYVVSFLVFRVFSSSFLLTFYPTVQLEDLSVFCRYVYSTFKVYSFEFTEATVVHGYNVMTSHSLISFIHFQRRT